MLRVKIKVEYTANAGYKVIDTSNKVAETACKVNKNIEKYLAEGLNFKSIHVILIHSSLSSKHHSTILIK